MLYSLLKSVHKHAAEAGDLPTAQVIVKADIPYLDAFIEENHRWGQFYSHRHKNHDQRHCGHRSPNTEGD